MNVRRIMIIVLIVFLVGVAGFLVYYFAVYRQQIPAGTVDVALPEGQEIQLTAEERQAGVTFEQKHEQLRRALDVTVNNAVSVARVFEQPVLAPVLSVDEQRLYFFDVERQVFRSSNVSGGDVTALAPGTFEGVTDVTWSLQRDAAILHLGSGSATRYSVYDFAAQTLTPLDARISSPAFSPDGLRIAYLFRDEASNLYRIAVALRDGTQPLSLKVYRAPDIELSWFDDETIAYRVPASGYEATSLYTIDARGQQTRTLVADQYALDAVFSGSTGKVAFSQAGRKPHQASLAVMNVDGTNVIDTTLNTLARKCVWSQSGLSLYCAVPSVVDRSAVIPEDYNERRLVTRDDLYQVQADTGQATAIVRAGQLAQSYDAEDLFITSDLGRIYFTRRHDGLLYTFLLP